MVVSGQSYRSLVATCVAVMVLALGACSGSGGLFSKGAPPAYDLSAATDFPRRAGGARGQLVITEPAALAPYDSEKIVVRPTPGEAAQLGDAQWQDRLPRLMQARILQSFENASRLRAVGRPADKITNDFALLTDVRAFEMSAADNAAIVEIAAKIVRENSGRIMAARVFRVVVPSTEMQGPGAIGALNDAFVKAQTQLVLWAARVV